MKRWRAGWVAGLVLALSAATYHAADVSGSWTCNVQLTGGPSLTQTFVFKQDGEKLTGTRAGPTVKFPKGAGEWTATKSEAK
jgi:hypothetical protein